MATEYEIVYTVRGLLAKYAYKTYLKGGPSNFKKSLNLLTVLHSSDLCGGLLNFRLSLAKLDAPSGLWPGTSCPSLPPPLRRPCR